MLYSYLPLLRGWAYNIVNIVIPITVPAGDERLIIKSDKPGWVWNAFAVVDNPDAKFIIRLGRSPTEYQEIDFSPRELMRSGITSPNPMGIYVARYNDTDKHYNVAYAPSNPLPYKGYSAILLRAPTYSPVKLRGGGIYIEIYDIEEFINSYQELLSLRALQPLRAR